MMKSMALEECKEFNRKLYKEYKVSLSTLTTMNHVESSAMKIMSQKRKFN